MATTTKVAKNIYRIDKNSGEFIRYLIRVKVAPDDERSTNRRTLAAAEQIRDEWIAIREGRGKEAGKPPVAAALKHWGFI